VRGKAAHPVGSIDQLPWGQDVLEGAEAIALRHEPADLGQQFDRLLGVEGLMGLVGEIPTVDHDGLVAILGAEITRLEDNGLIIFAGNADETDATTGVLDEHGETPRVKGSTLRGGSLGGPPNAPSHKAHPVPA
jgi:hypothetical protein